MTPLGEGGGSVLFEVEREVDGVAIRRDLAILRARRRRRGKPKTNESNESFNRRTR